MKKNNLKKLAQKKDKKKDKDIDYSDIAESSADFWKDAKVVDLVKKEKLSLRLDADILDWFKSQGKGYQTRINNALKSYVEYQVSHGK